jgi:uncharacterized membrane protein
VSKAEGDPERQRKDLPYRDAYTQINVLFGSPSVELPSAEKFKEFPEEAQKSILAAFRIEQQHRHQWLSAQQTNDHALNMLRQRHAFWSRVLGLIAGVVLVLASFACGVWLIQMGQPLWGVACFIGSVAGLIGTAVYGHIARGSPSHEPRTSMQPPDSPQLTQK